MTPAAEEIKTVNGGLYVCAIVEERETNSELIKCANEAQGEIKLIGYGEITAVVMVQSVDQPVSRDRQELVRKLLVHQQLVEKFMEIAAVLPVKFGTLAPNRESVELALERGRDKFITAFSELSGKTQFEITVSWDVAEVFAEIAKEPTVIDLKADLAAMSENDRHLNLDQLGKLVKETLDHRRTQIGKALLDALLHVGFDGIVNPVLNDSIVLNMALLVDIDRTEALDLCLDELDNTFHNALTLRCVGPMPPHSFATVEIIYMEPTKVSHACCILELVAANSFEEVRSAYHRLARQAHQEIASDRIVDGTVCSSIGELNDAYKTLISFVDAGGPVVVSVLRQEAAYATDMASSTD